MAQIRILKFVNKSMVSAVDNVKKLIGSYIEDDVEAGPMVIYNPTDDWTVTFPYSTAGDPVINSIFQSKKQSIYIHITARMIY